MINTHKEHLFWRYMPETRKTRKACLNLYIRRILAWLGGRQQRISVAAIGYIVLWSIPLFLGQHLISLFALLPLILVPPVGWLIYQLVWKEFHE